MYFIDNTEFLDISKKFEEGQMCIGIIMIDSYEELVQNMGQEEKVQVVTEIESKIYDWVSKQKQIE